MSDSTIAVRDQTTGGAKDVKTKLDASSVHSTVHVVTRAIPEDMVYGVAATTDVSAHSLIAAPATSPADRRNYVCSVQVANKGSNASLVGLYDGAPSSPDVALAFIYCPNGQTVTAQFVVPIRGSVGNAIYMLADTASTTIYVSAQGFTGP